jgi:hypothetical protein
VELAVDPIAAVVLHLDPLRFERCAILTAAAIAGIPLMRAGGLLGEDQGQSQPPRRSGRARRMWLSGEAGVIGRDRAVDRNMC